MQKSNYLWRDIHAMSFIITARNTAQETYYYPASGRWTKRSDDAAIYDDKLEADRICANLAYKWKGLKVQVEPKADVTGGQQLKLSSLSEGLRQEVRKHMKEGKAKFGTLPQKLKTRILKETGEWDESDEHMTAWKSKLESDIRDISDATNGRMKLKSIHGFDAYQGPYAWVDIDGRNYKVWTVNEEGSDDLWIENYKNDNTSMHDKLPGFQGRPDEITYMLTGLGFMQHGYSLNEIRTEIQKQLKNRKA